MRDAMADLGGDPARIKPLVPVDLVIDHSIQVDVVAAARRLRPQRRARVRAQPRALRVPALGPDGVRRLPGRAAQHRHLPPGEPRVPGPRGVRRRGGRAYPDTLVGTDSHTPMVNGLGVLGWGVGGIEAEAAMLGQPISMLIPQVVGFKLTASCPRAPPPPTWCSPSPRCCAGTAWSASSSSSTAPACRHVPLENRATIGNMSPEYGSTIAIFPIDDETLRYLRFTGRPEPSWSPWSRPTPRSRASGTTPTAEPALLRDLELDLSTVVPEPGRAGAGPRTASPLDRAKAALPGRPAPAVGAAPGRTTGQDEAVGRVVPGQRPAGRHGGDGRRRRPRRRAAPLAEPDRPAPAAGATTAVPVDAGGRHRVRARPRPRRHRRHHQLHQHVEPVGDGRRRPAGQEGRRAGARPPSRG